MGIFRARSANRIEDGLVLTESFIRISKFFMKYFYFISKYGPISNSNVDTTVITDRNTYIEKYREEALNYLHRRMILDLLQKSKDFNISISYYFHLKRRKIVSEDCLKCCPCCGVCFTFLITDLFFTTINGSSIFMDQRVVLNQFSNINVIMMIHITYGIRGLIDEDILSESFFSIKKERKKDIVVCQGVSQLKKLIKVCQLVGVTRGKSSYFYPLLNEMLFSAIVTGLASYYAPLLGSNKERMRRLLIGFEGLNSFYHPFIVVSKEFNIFPFFLCEMCVYSDLERYYIVSDIDMVEVGKSIKVKGL
ncbi:hypothetical protein H8356DRAFT_1333206 [Neocallimastix lanati (nom. inval.)]|nr:hypothetical protein H8356DRAFT_1333206 [Neocallimastix sp. JGI-2020a]